MQLNLDLNLLVALDALLEEGSVGGAADHLNHSRRGRFTGPIDTALAEHGLTRRVVAICPTFASARRFGLATFPIPLDLPAPRLSLARHPRYAADPAHAWLRGLVGEVVRSELGDDAG
ncbi:MULTISPECIES: hypothetical protein [unclassified Streptomyces]|uniref:hypothetical protein n=1 Tax=unclassified Streptomyces TaxID=2593676 RepID=UPI0006AE5B7B|nr:MULTISPECIES: hypothetical protein [unclassified Streptomyces]KOX26938.1 hypothetical protein ADL06_15020 [Streptomyces sp. NRRL F-6491]KOX44851.1 hypothetical protein ADL08_14020 [Streptomyces sp. NRRL F-6492]